MKSSTRIFLHLFSIASLTMFVFLAGIIGKFIQNDNQGKTKVANNPRLPVFSANQAFADFTPEGTYTGGNEGGACDGINAQGAPDPTGC